MIKYIDLSNKISKRSEGKDYINRIMHLNNLLAPDKYRLDNMNMLASIENKETLLTVLIFLIIHLKYNIINNKNYNYENINQTSPISDKSVGTNFLPDIIGGAFSTNRLSISYVRVNQFARGSVSVFIL